MSNGTSTSPGKPLGESGSIRLFGQKLAGVAITDAGALGGRFSGLAKPIFAWIYGFSFEGHYNDLARPCLFVVDDVGVDTTDELPVTGLPTDPPEFSEGVSAWLVDRDDMSIRMMVDSGPYDRILLEAELRGDRLAGSYSGANISYGANVSLQGANRPLAGTSVRRSD